MKVSERRESLKRTKFAFFALCTPLCILASMILIEPPYTERYVRWCERTGASHPLLLNLNIV
jgi:hypothetical protein